MLLRIWNAKPRLRDVLNALGRPWCLSRLRKLSITDRHEVDAEEILKAVSPTLQTLEWFVGPVYSSDKYVNIPLHLMSNLHSLFFCARALDKNIIISVARLSEAICHIPPGTIAKELSVSLYITDVYDIELIALVTRYTVWSKLDSALAFASVRLRRVNVYFNILVAYYNRDLNLAPDRIKSTADVVNQLLFENLPLLHKAGVLQVQAGIDLFKFDED